MTTPPQQRSVQDLPDESLVQLQKNFEAELRRLEGSLGALGEASERYSASLATAKALGGSGSEPQKLLIPLTSSMYAPGVTLGTGRLMVDLGTGFFAEMDGKDAEGVLERRIEYVRKNMDVMRKQYAVKRQNHDTVRAELQARMASRGPSTKQQQQQQQA